MLLADKFLHEYLVTLRDIDFGVSIKSSARCNATHARRLLTPLLGQITAGAQFAFHLDEMVLRPFQRWPNRILLGMIRTEARSQQAVNALGIRLHGSRITRDDAPSDATSGHEIVLRHAAEGHTRHIGRDRSECDVWRVFQNQLVIDLV